MNDMKESQSQDESDKLDDAFHDMEMLYKSRCVDVPLTSNVKVVDLDKKGKDEAKEDN